MEIMSNIALIVLAVSAIVIVITNILGFVKLPTSMQLEQAKQVLIYFVIEAEKLFGSKTGKLKLRYVYDKFLERFGEWGKLISFEKFSDLVDEALTEMKTMLENEKLQEYVGIEINNADSNNVEEVK